MGIVRWLFGDNIKSKSKIFTDKEIADAGACPNCWGTQAYEGKYVQYVKDQTKSNIDHDKQHQKTFVQQFIETEVTGDKLKNGTCSVCGAD